MKLSLKWVERINNIYHCAANPAPDGPEALIEKIGAQLGAVEEVIDLGEKYKGIYVAKVVNCQKHPNADKLSVCLIDDSKTVKNVKRNKDGLIEVVCGAPNVAAGQLVAWLPPGSTVPSTTDKEPLVLEARELRGVVSNGMIASLKELDLGDDHGGILVIDQPAKPGQPFAEVYELNDHIIDIENKMFTHRPDLFGILGLAREIAGIQQQVFRSPKFYDENASLPKPRGRGLAFGVRNELPKVVPRFTAVVIRDVKVGPSPIWLQSFLSRVGIRPINNVVDMTNFYMYGTAQPLHAYDYDKVGSKIVIRKPKAGESLKLLGGKTIKLKTDDIVIASATEAIGLGGVMGGAGSEVTKDTTNIILECANFSSTAVRRSAMEHGLFTDAATRFNKDQSARQNLAVLCQAASALMHPTIAGGRLASPAIDIKNFDAKPITVKTTADFINSRLGVNLSLPEIKKILSNVEFKVKASGQSLAITAPFWRTDIKIPEDLVEEVGRLYGYDHLPLELPNKTLEPAEKNPAVELKRRLRQILSAGGANEVLTYSFVHERLLRAVGQKPANSYHIKNALSPDLQFYRQTLAPSLLEKVHPNKRNRFDDFVLFEIGKGHVKGIEDKSKLPLEFDSLAAVVVNEKQAGAPYYWARYIVDYLLDQLNFEQWHYSPFEARKNQKPDVLNYYEPSRSALVWQGDSLVGMVGEPKAAVRQTLKLPSGVSMFELEINKLLEFAGQTDYEPLNRFPATDQDICLKVSDELNFGELDYWLWRQLKHVADKDGYKFDYGVIDIFQRDLDKLHKQITWRISLEHPQKTLTTAEANQVLDTIAGNAKKQFGAERI